MSEEQKHIFYIAQEAAMAPSIVKEWPEIIPHPKTKLGRLKKSKLSLYEVVQLTITEAWNASDDSSLGDLTERILRRVNL